MTPAAGARRRARWRGVALVLGLLTLGAAAALVARRYRIPGSAPRLRLLPVQEDLLGRGRDWVPPPGRVVPVRPVSRARFVDGAGRERGRDLEFRGDRLVGTPRRGDDGAWILEFRPGTVAEPAPAEEDVEVAPAGGAAAAVRLPARPSTREDALDVPVFRVAIP